MDHLVASHSLSISLEEKNVYLQFQEIVNDNYK